MCASNGFVNEMELRGTVVWRDLSSTGQRHHVNRQRFPHRYRLLMFMIGYIIICRTVAKKRSSCWLPADWCPDSSARFIFWFLLVSIISHTAWKSHVFSSYWRTSDHFACWLRIWNTAISNISPLMLIYAEHQLHTNYSSMWQATFRQCGRILVIEHYSVGTKKATEDKWL